MLRVALTPLGLEGGQGKVNVLVGINELSRVLEGVEGEVGLSVTGHTHVLGASLLRGLSWASRRLKLTYAVVDWGQLSSKSLMSLLHHLGVRTLIALSSPEPAWLSVRCPSGYMRCLALDESLRYRDVEVSLGVGQGDLLVSELPQILGEPEEVLDPPSPRMPRGAVIAPSSAYYDDIQVVAKELVDFTSSLCQGSDEEALCNVLPWPLIAVLRGMRTSKASIFEDEEVSVVTFRGAECLSTRVESTCRASDVEVARLEPVTVRLENKGVVITYRGRRYRLACQGSLEARLEATPYLCRVLFRTGEGEARLYVVGHDVLMYLDGLRLRVKLPFRGGAVNVWHEGCLVRYEELGQLTVSGVPGVDYYSSISGVSVVCERGSVLVDTFKGVLSIKGERGIMRIHGPNPLADYPWKLLLEQHVKPLRMRVAKEYLNRLLMHLGTVHVVPVHASVRGGWINLTLWNYLDVDSTVSVYLWRHPLRAYEVSPLGVMGSRAAVIGRNVFTFIPSYSYKSLRVVVARSS